MPVNESSEDYELHFETEEYYEICKFSEVGWKILIGWKIFLSMWDVRHRFTGILHIKIAIVIQAWFHKEIPGFALILRVRIIGDFMKSQKDAYQWLSRLNISCMGNGDNHSMQNHI